MFRFLHWILLIFLACSCGSNLPRGTLRIGVDASWYPLDFGPQTPLVNGYTADLLLEMARYSGMHFELVSANWDALAQGLGEKKYDAILSSMEVNEYLSAKYDFSDNYLDLGTVLIVQMKSDAVDLARMKGSMIGIVANDKTALVAEKYPTLIIRSYSSIPDLLNAVAAQEIQGALLSRIPAVNFVRDLYADRLKIVGQPLTGAGLKLVAIKGRAGAFNQTLETLRKRKTLETLLKKWQLG